MSWYVPSPGLSVCQVMLIFFPFPTCSLISPDRRISCFTSVSAFDSSQVPPYLTPPALTRILPLEVVLV